MNTTTLTVLQKLNLWLRKIEHEGKTTTKKMEPNAGLAFLLGSGMALVFCGVQFLRAWQTPMNAINTQGWGWQHNIEAIWGFGVMGLALLCFIPIPYLIRSYRNNQQYTPSFPLANKTWWTSAVMGALAGAMHTVLLVFMLALHAVTGNIVPSLQQQVSSPAFNLPDPFQNNVLNTAWFQQTGEHLALVPERKEIWCDLAQHAVTRELAAWKHPVPPYQIEGIWLGKLIKDLQRFDCHGDTETAQHLQTLHNGMAALHPQERFLGLIAGWTPIGETITVSQKYLSQAILMDELEFCAMVQQQQNPKTIGFQECQKQGADAHQKLRTMEEYREARKKFERRG